MLIRCTMISRFMYSIGRIKLKEVARLLFVISNRIRDGFERNGTVLDLNGNTVGNFREEKGVFTVIIQMENDIFQDMD
jgi:hypothetical protein